MKIAVEGCAHGELNKIYESIQFIEMRESIKIDLLICCGDFQSVRNHDDMVSMAVPVKYREMKDFPDYYNGKRKAPVLTLFIGGNHEAANYLWELPYGGWVAENIFYMGYAGVVNFAGLRIGGLSGIYKQKDYYKGHFEIPPFNEDTKRSFYHVRSCDVAKLKLLNEQPIDIFLSHDWPKRIYHHGEKEQLIRFKPFLKDEILSNTLGSDAAEDLLNVLKPKYWFSGHMHAKFSAIVQHSNGESTKFLALDKCLPRRNFLQVIDMGVAQQEPVLSYDKHWISVLQSTNDTFSKSCKQTFLVELSDDYKPNEKRLENLEATCSDFTVLPFAKSVGTENQQTTLLCMKFNLVNPCSTVSPVVNNQSGSSRFTPKNRKMSLPKPVQNKIKTANKIVEAKNTSREDEDEFSDITNPNMKNTSREDEDEFSDITNPNMSSNPEEINISESSESDDSDDSDKDNDGDDDDERIAFTEPPSFIETPLKTIINSPPVNITSRDGADISSCISERIAFTEPPSFIETPLKTIINSPPVNITSRDGADISSCISERITFTEPPSFIETPLKTIINSPPVNISSSDGADISSCISDERDSCGETPIPKKKFKLVRRNQGIYSGNDEGEES